jgi:hypothetical protein
LHLPRPKSILLGAAAAGLSLLSAMAMKRWSQLLCLALLSAAARAVPVATTKPSNILFLMCDSMDGRVLDPTSAVSQRMEMPNLRRLASLGTHSHPGGRAIQTALRTFRAWFSTQHKLSGV